MNSKPPSAVDSKEIIGRRIFEDAVWNGDAGSAKKRVRIDHFLDDRLDDGVSVDRLGLNNPVKTVRRVLTPISIRAAEAQNKGPFRGWVAIANKDIDSWPFHVVSDPVVDGVEDCNPHHALIDRAQFVDRFPEWKTDAKIRKTVARNLAFLLKERYERAKSFRFVDGEPSQNPPPDK